MLHFLLVGNIRRSYIRRKITRKRKRLSMFNNYFFRALKGDQSTRSKI